MHSNFSLKASVSSSLGTQPNDPSVMLHCSGVRFYLHSLMEEADGFGSL